MRKAHRYQFFDATASPVSSHKKRRVETSHSEEHDDELPQMSQDGFAMSMPGYHDDVHAGGLDADEEQTDILQHELEPGTITKLASSTAPTVCDSLKPSSSVSASVSSATHRKLVSAAKHDRNEADQPLASALECPICGKMLETDNQGLNEHVDFCLSKQAIKEAQTASLQSTSNGTKDLFSLSKRRGSKSTSRQSKAGGSGQGEGLFRYRKKD